MIPKTVTENRKKGKMKLTFGIILFVLVCTAVGMISGASFDKVGVIIGVGFGLALGAYMFYG